MRKIHIRQTTTTRATDAEQSTSGKGSGKRQKRGFKEENRKLSVVNSHVLPPPPLSSFGYVYVCLEEKGRRSYDNRKGYETFFLSCMHIHFLSRIVSLSRIFRPFHCYLPPSLPLSGSPTTRTLRRWAVRKTLIDFRGKSLSPTFTYLIIALSFLIVNIKRRSGVDSRVRVG